MSESPAPPPVQPLSTTPEIPIPATMSSTMHTQSDFEGSMLAQPAPIWFDATMNTQSQPSIVPYTTDSSSYTQNQAFQSTTMPKTLPQQKPLYSWSNQAAAMSMPGTYRDFGQPTPSTASTWLYGQTPSTAESFGQMGPGLTPLTGQQPDISYTGLSPTLAGMTQGGGLHTASLDAQPRRPGPIRHHSAHSVSGVPMFSNPSGGGSSYPWPYSYPSQVPPPLKNSFTLSQPPFNARRPNVMSSPMYPPDQMWTPRRLHPSPDSRGGQGPYRGMHRVSGSDRYGHGGHMKQGSFGQDQKPPRFKPTAEQKAILIDAYEKNPYVHSSSRLDVY